MTHRQDRSSTLSIEEAAAVLRIGRTTAYRLAHEWRSTGGRRGLPVLELGRTLRVPCAALDRMLREGCRSGQPVSDDGRQRPAVGPNNGPATVAAASASSEGMACE